jgi:glycosyltransferase involved in cell wall biosynthesis
MLAGLTRRLYGQRTEHVVVSMTTIGEVGEQIRESGVEVHALGMTRGIPSLVGLSALMDLIRVLEPDLVHSWMYHADLISALVCAWCRTPVIWNVRQSDVNNEKFLARFLCRAINPPLSYMLPKKIVYCGDAAAQVHHSYGYDTRKSIVILNGVDTDRFTPSNDLGLELRRRFAIPSSAPLIGMVGRLHPMKDHHAFITAAARVAEADPSTWFLMCGEGISADAPAINGAIRRAGLNPAQVVLIGPTKEVQAVYSALTICVLSSCGGEGFPNVLAEAMACGVPCVATDVGEAKQIIGDTGWVTPPRDPRALADGILQLLRLLNVPNASSRQSAAARARVINNYSIDRAAANYEELYLSTV